MFTNKTLRFKLGYRTMHVPLPPSSPVVQVSEFRPNWLQWPTTVAPLSGLWSASCTVISTVADHRVPLVDVIASRLPTWMTTDGVLTVTLVEAWLFAGFVSSPNSWRAVSVWLPNELLVVFHGNTTVAVAPAARAGRLCVPIVTLSVASCSVTTMPAATPWFPTFRTATLTFTVFPCVTDAGAPTLVMATSITGVGGGGGGPPSSILTPKLLSTRSMRFAI